MGGRRIAPATWGLLIIIIVVLALYPGSLSADNWSQPPSDRLWLEVNRLEYFPQIGDHSPGQEAFLVLLGVLHNDTPDHHCSFARDLRVYLDGQEYRPDGGLMGAYQTTLPQPMDYLGPLFGQCLDAGQSASTFAVFDVPLNTNTPEIRFYGETLPATYTVSGGPSGAPPALQATSTPSSAAPPVSTASSSWYEVHFSAPTGSSDPTTYANGPDTVLAAAIDATQHTVDVAAFEMNSPAITRALLNAHARGVIVRIVTDDESGLDVSLYQEYLAADAADREDLADEFEEPLEDTTLDDLYNAGIPIVDDDRGALMHNKFAILDSTSVWTGSLNMTINGSYRNNNNLIRISDPRLVQNYQTEFNEMFVDRQFGPRSPANTPNPVFDIGDTRIGSFFAPEDDVVPAIITGIGAAQRNIRFLAFSFTLDEVAQAMLARAQQGVQVQGVFETTGSETQFSQMTPLFCAGQDVRQDGNPFILHHKVIIIDDQYVLTGSFNFSANATEQNDENLLIIHNPDIAALYIAEFEARFAEAHVPDITCSGPRPTLVSQMCLVTASNVNIRSGPGTGFNAVGAMSGQTLAVVGRNEGGDWYAVDYNGSQAWVAVSVVTASGSCDTLSAIAAPAQPIVPPAQATTVPQQQPTAPPQVPPTVAPPPAEPTQPPAPPAPAFTCDCSKTCEAMASCEEAYFQLQQCGCTRRDGDGDGVPCESICLGG